MTASRTDVYKVAFDEALRAISDQRNSLEALRARAGVLISAAALVTSFLGGQALRDGEIGIAGWIAMGSFASVGVVAVLLLVLKGRLSFYFSPRLIIDQVENDRELSIDVVHRDLSLYAEKNYDNNVRFLRLLDVIFGVGGAFLVLELGAWVAELVTRSN